MSEIRGFTCDGGCGATAVLDRPHEPVTRNGWFTTFGPAGYPTMHTCSLQCLIRTAEHHGGRNERELRP